MGRIYFDISGNPKQCQHTARQNKTQLTETTVRTKRLCLAVAKLIRILNFQIYVSLTFTNFLCLGLEYSELHSIRDIPFRISEIQKL